MFFGLELSSASNFGKAQSYEKASDFCRRAKVEQIYLAFSELIRNFARELKIYYHYGRNTKDKTRFGKRFPQGWFG